MIFFEKKEITMIGRFIVISFLLISCGQGSRTNMQKHISASTPITLESDIKIPMLINNTKTMDAAALDLTTSATAWTLGISGCSSGFSNPSLEGSITPLVLTKGDTSCLLKLVSFVFSGLTYTHASGGISSGSSIYTSGSNELMVVFQNTISDPIVESDFVSVSVSNLSFTTITGMLPITITRSSSIQDSDGKYFEWNGSAYTTIDTNASGSSQFLGISNFNLSGSSSGKGLFDFSLSCIAGGQNLGSGNALCSNMDSSSQLNYVLTTNATELDSSSETTRRNAARNAFSSAAAEETSASWMSWNGSSAVLNVSNLQEPVVLGSDNGDSDLSKDIFVLIFKFKRDNDAELSYEIFRIDFSLAPP